MKIIDYEECEYCQEIESTTHACLTCERTQDLWWEITIWAINLGYHNFRLEQKMIIPGDIEIDKIFNLSIIIG